MVRCVFTQVQIVWLLLCIAVGLNSPEEKAAAQTFYEDMGTIALEKK